MYVNESTWYVVGITSFGRRVCASYPTVYTRTSAFRSWISCKSNHLNKIFVKVCVFLRVISWSQKVQCSEMWKILQLYKLLQGGAFRVNIVIDTCYYESASFWDFVWNNELQSMQCFLWRFYINFCFALQNWGVLYVRHIKFCIKDV